MDGHLRQRLLAAGMARLAAGGPLRGLTRAAAQAVGCPPAAAARFFPGDLDLVGALYLHIGDEVEEAMATLPAGGIDQRVAALLRAKLAAAAPWRRALARLRRSAGDSAHPVGVAGARQQVARTRMQALFAAACSAVEPAPERRARLARWCHALHLAALWWWSLAARSPAGERRLAALVGGAAAAARVVLRLPVAAAAADRLAGLADRPGDPAVAARAEAVLGILLRQRRLLPAAGACATAPCAACLALHAARVRAAIAAGEPLRCVLPAFPAKSPNPRKTAGRRADLAEEAALRHLQGLCDAVAAVHPPGMRIAICSDGRAFADLVGVADADVEAYAADIAALIAGHGLGALDCFHLDDAYPPAPPAELRRRLCADWARPAAAVAAELRRPPRDALFNGIHRFLAEDLAARHPGRSRSAAKRAAGPLAVEVIRRSDAWSRLLAACFPTALRLSIHPQHAHAAKIGVRLGEAADAWLTPWHAVALRDGAGLRLVHRSQAEALGARAVERDGRFSHYELAAT